MVGILKGFYVLISTTKFNSNFQTYSASLIGRWRIGSELADNFSFVMHSPVNWLKLKKGLRERQIPKCPEPQELCKKVSFNLTLQRSVKYLSQRSNHERFNQSDHDKRFLYNSTDFLASTITVPSGVQHGDREVLLFKQKSFSPEITRKLLFPFKLRWPKKIYIVENRSHTETTTLYVKFIVNIAIKIFDLDWRN